ncbi:MAG: methyltransferase domain-containing protein [Candidatus Electryonea clarkiae]|nr:methyltransferase domain-containing protein [Candidatus Electryonea clarkiae]MDP8287795.1 methyltransferase domain-containing protein [Candidatus Electryonea clarkiae]
MIERDNVARANKQLWEKEVEEGCGYTIPWLDLDIDLLTRYARGELDPSREPMFKYLPSIILDVKDKDILCLAMGGGQQSAIFGILGARVTVLDLSDGMIEGDNKAAAHYGYEVNAIQGDMRDLSRLDDASFDYVQGGFMCYIPDVREVYPEVARVIRQGGIYASANEDPGLRFIEWDSNAYRFTQPFSERIEHREDGGIEFRHHMSDIFNGLLESGFSIKKVHKFPNLKTQNLKAQPSTWEHQESYFAGSGFTVVAEKL